MNLFYEQMSYFKSFSSILWGSWLKCIRQEDGKKTEETLQSINETLKRIEGVLKKDKDISLLRRIKECVSNLHLAQGQ